MIQRLVAISVISLVISACATSAQKKPEIRQLSPSLQYFDCDASAGHSSRLVHTNPQPITYVEGDFRLNRFKKKYPVWLSGVSIGLLTSDQQIIVEAELFRVRQSQGIRADIIVGSGEEIKRYKAEGEFSVGEIVPFKIAVSDTKNAIVNIGVDGETHSFPIKGIPIQLQLKCSSAWAEINVHDVWIRKK